MKIRTCCLVFFVLLAWVAFAEDLPDLNAPDTNFYNNQLSTLDTATSEDSTWSIGDTFEDNINPVARVGNFFVSGVVSGDGSCSAPDHGSYSSAPINDTINSFLSSSISILIGVVSVAALLAAFIYAVGQAFGAETRARAITLASTLLVSSTVVLVLFFLTYNITPILFSNFSATPDNFFVNLEIIAPAATIALGVFAIAGALYVIGGFLQIQSITAAAKEELFESIVTLVRVLFIGLSLTGASLAFYSLASAPGGNGDPIYMSVGSGGSIDLLDASISISLNMLKEIVRNYGFMLIYNTILHSMYTSTLFFGLSWRAMYSFSLGPIFRPFVDVLGQMMQFMQIAIAEWVVHAATLCAIKRWSWELFIPFGIILRAIPQTRGGGDALLALIFAFLIVYPLMFVVDYEIHKLMRGILVDPGDLVGSFVGDGGLGGMIATAGIMMFLTASVFMPLFAGAAMNLLVELSKNAIYYIVLMSLILPFLNIFITLTFAREQAKFFNVDVNFMSFTRLI